MQKYLLVLLAVLAACSEKTPSEKKSKHANAPITTNTTGSLTKASTKATTIISLTRDKVSVEAKEAFLNLYGGETWADKSIGEYFKDKAEGYISPKFEGRFTEGGADKLLVLGYITPDKEYFCHACVPLIGGAIFRKQESKWIVESAQKIIGWGDVLETGDFNLVRIGPDQYGVSIHITDAHQGYEDNRYEILVPYQGRLIIALDDGYIEKPGEAAYTESEVELSAQDLSIKFEQGNNPNYFDAVVRARYNDGNSPHLIRKDETKRYQFHNGKFEPI